MGLYLGSHLLRFQNSTYHSTVYIINGCSPLVSVVTIQFIVEELHDEDNGSRATRQKMFHHQNKDDHISVKDVWGTWYKSEGDLSLSLSLSLSCACLQWTPLIEGHYFNFMKFIQS